MLNNDHFISLGGVNLGDDLEKLFSDNVKVLKAFNCYG
jgi:hypothetical protein